MSGHPFDFYGQNVVAESNWASGSVGVIVNGQRLTNAAYRLGQNLAQAGADGISVKGVMRNDIQMLEYAGHVIETDAIGLTYYLRGPLREPEQYLVPVKAKREEKVVPFVTAGWTGTGGR